MKTAIRSVVMGTMVVIVLGASACTSTTPSEPTNASTTSEQSASSAVPPSSSVGDPTSATMSSQITEQPATELSSTPADAAGESSSQPSSVASESALPAPATTVVAPAGGGNITETVEAGVQTTLESAPLTEPVVVAGSISAEIASAERIQGTARLPGEIAGDALALRVRITNTGAEPLALTSVTVSLEDAAKTPATPLSAAPAEPFTGSLDPGQSAEGVYVFTFPAGSPNPISITVSYSTDAPVVLFVGDVQ